MVYCFTDDQDCATGNIFMDMTWISMIMQRQQRGCYRKFSVREHWVTKFSHQRIHEIITTYFFNGLILYPVGRPPLLTSDIPLFSANPIHLKQKQTISHSELSLLFRDMLDENNLVYHNYVDVYMQHIISPVKTDMGIFSPIPPPPCLLTYCA